MELKFKKLDYKTTDKDGNEIEVKSEGILPTRATPGDAGLVINQYLYIILTLLLKYQKVMQVYYFINLVLLKDL